jgi:hypothetical protein
VKVGLGRDYRDVPPNKGVYRGNAEESIDVQVQTVELASVPSELAAERFQQLAVPVFPDATGEHRSMTLSHQQEQQQQQKQL